MCLLTETLHCLIPTYILYMQRRKREENDNFKFSNMGKTDYVLMKKKTEVTKNFKGCFVITNKDI